MKKGTDIMKKSVLAFLSGVVVSAVVFTAIPAIAANLEATFNGVQINVEDKTVASIGQSYSPGGVTVPTSILYQGTTYLPIRKISEALKMPIEYQAETKTVSIWKHGGSIRLFDNIPEVADAGWVLDLEPEYVSDDGYTYFYDISNKSVNEFFDYGNALLDCGMEFAYADTDDDGDMWYGFCCPRFNNPNQMCYVMYTHFFAEDGRAIMGIRISYE